MEQNQPEIEKKESKMSKLKEKLHPRNLILAPLVFIKNLIKKFVISLLPIITLLLGFFLGARMHETGFLAGKLGKDLKNATVFLSGKCMVNGKERIPALLEDQVKITGLLDDKIEGVVRATRERVVCSLSEISTDSLPLLSDIMKAPSKKPEITAPIIVEEEKPDYLKYKNQRLLVSGSCVSVDDQPIPTFTDEKIDVSDIIPQENNKKEFKLIGTKRSDKLQIKCLSNAISYRMDDLKEEPKVEEVKPEVKTYIGETLMITGVCYPDERVNKFENGKKIAQFRFTGSKVQVIDSELDSTGKIVKFLGTALGDSKEDPVKGRTVICEQKKYPFYYKEFNPEEHELVIEESKKEPVKKEEIKKEENI